MRAYAITREGRLALETAAPSVQEAARVARENGLVDYHLAEVEGPIDADTLRELSALNGRTVWL